jgi:hypothetical protein
MAAWVAAQTEERLGIEEFERCGGVAEWTIP